MSVLAWMGLGLIAGLVASNILSHSGQGLLLDIVLGIVGAVVGGFLVTAIGARGVTGFDRALCDHDSAYAHGSARPDCGGADSERGCNSGRGG